MPATAELPAAAAPAAAPAKAPSTTPGGAKTASAAAMLPQINVSSMPTGAEPPKPAPPGSAKSKMMGDLRSKYGGETSEPKPDSPAQPPAAPPPGSEAGSPADSPPAGADAAKPEGAIAPVENKKISPWKLVETFKARALRAETELAEMAGKVIPEEQRKAMEERTTQAEARLKELEDEIRHVRYEKSAEFQDKFQKPYESAWKRAMSELSEIPVIDPGTGQPRAAEAADLLQLVNMPLGQAREVAEQLFGKFAGDMMNYRKEIRGLYEAQAAALEDAKKNGGEREKQRQEQAQRTVGELKQKLAVIWEKSLTEAMADPKRGEFFKPRDGDEEWNSRLEKGEALVKQAFSENPFAPNLTDDERAAIIRRHAAVQKRAASWGALRHAFEKSKEHIAALEKELAEFKGSTPPAGGTTAPAGAPPAATGKAGMYAALQKLAK